MLIKLHSITSTLAPNGATKVERSHEESNKRASLSASSANSSSFVALSDEAMSLARLSSKGILVSSGEIATPLALGGGPTASGPLPNKESHPIGIEALTSLLHEMGADERTRKTLVQGLDTDHDQQVSEAEIMRGLSTAANDKTSQFAEVLRRFMDSYGDGSGSVSGHEFMAISSKLYAALKR